MYKSLPKIIRRDAIVLQSEAMEGMYFEDIRPNTRVVFQQKKRWVLL